MSQEECIKPKSSCQRHMELLDELEATARRWAMNDPIGSNWTLADDAKLATFLKEFSRHVQHRSCQVSKAVQRLDNNIEKAAVDVSCATGEFLSLADVRFVEQTVVIDGNVEGSTFAGDDEIDKYDGGEADGDVNADDNHLPTERQEEDAIRDGMAALQLFYDPANTSDSDHYFGLDPEDDSAYYYDSAPGDVYNQRPLPYIVGSREFLDSTDAGLGEDDEDEEEGAYEEGGDGKIGRGFDAAGVDHADQLVEKERPSPVSPSSSSERRGKGHGAE